jgi:ABC-type polysaccharide/polyol phosphate export permease
MGQLPTEHAVKVVLVIFVVGLFLMLWCLTKVRHRIVFWL